MKISIIIPVYEVEPYIRACLQSVIRQRYAGEIECLLIDDGSTDQSLALAEQLIAAYAGPIVFKVIRHPENRGLSAARNTGMQAATGDYLYFLDSDDEITADCLEQLAAPLQAEAYDLVVGDLAITGNPSSVDGLRLRLPDQTVLRGRAIIDTYRDQWNMIAVNKLYRTAFLKAAHLQFQEHLIHEDELWSFQVACQAESLVAVGHQTYLYKMRPGSIMDTSQHPKRAAAYTQIVKAMCQQVRQQQLVLPSTHRLIRIFFYSTLAFYADDPAQCAATYRELRPYVKTSAWSRFKANGFSLKGHLLDLHYYLPVSWASCWVRMSLKLLS